MTIRKDILGVMIISVLVCFQVALAQEPAEKPRKLHEVEGSVVQTDWVGSMMTIRWTQSDGYRPTDEITVKVPENLSITKGTETVTFADIEQGDRVDVTYYDDSPNPLRATNVAVRM